MTLLPLIPTDSPLYRKRLVKELNNQPDGNGFYYCGDAVNGLGANIRCKRARLRQDMIQIQSVYHARWLTASTPNPKFIDPYGRDICASRHAARNLATA